MLDCCLLGGKASNIMYCPRFSFTRFMSVFLARNGFGFKITAQLKPFVDLFCKIVNLKPDPSEELEGFLGEGEFALVEFDFRQDSEGRNYFL